MRWYEIVLCSFQPDPFVVKAGSPDEAVLKTIEWAKKTYPGMFSPTSENYFKLVDSGYPLLSEIGDWN